MSKRRTSRHEDLELETWFFPSRAKAVEFFRKHSKNKDAQALAGAEKLAGKKGWSVEWEVEHYGMVVDGFDDTVLSATLCDEAGDVVTWTKVSNLSHNQRRVVAAELALEARSLLKV